MRNKLKRVMRIVLGCLLLLLGLVGLILPLLQGWLFLAMGCIVLSRDVPFLARMEKKLTARSPRARRILDRLRAIFPLLAD